VKYKGPAVGIYGGARLLKPAPERDMELIVYSYELAAGGDRVTLELGWAAGAS
jgi:hypothetical protein